MPKKLFLPEGVLDAGMVMQKMCMLRKRSIAGGVSASNFLVTGQCTPDFFFFPLNTDHHGATTFLFLFRSSKRHFYE